MTTNKTFHASPGERFHALTAATLPVGGGLFSGGEVVERGRTVTITADLIEATKNKHGVSWLDLVNDAEGQIEKWGEVRFAPGPWPDDTETWVQGDPVWELNRAKAQSAAWAVADEGDRAKALRAVLSRYGAGQPTSTETARFSADRPTDGAVSPSPAPRRGGLYA